MLRYLRRLQDKDLALDRSMIPLGSCTMKLNATAEMIPVTWPEFGALHPFAPQEQAAGLPAAVRRARGDAAPRSPASMRSRCSRTPAARASTRACSRSATTTRRRGDGERDVCLIPASAHGTNPASAIMAGLKVVVVGCDAQGNVDLADLEAKAAQHKDRLAALMITYPSTHGVFEDAIRDICATVHARRRPGLSGRRQPERAGRHLPPGRDRRRRRPSQPAQDLLHPARRRRPGHGADRGQGASRPVPAGPRGRRGRQPGRRAISDWPPRSRRPPGARPRSCRSPGPTSR